MRYPKKQPFMCTVAWWQDKGYYCYNTKQKLGHDGGPNNPKCVACREHYKILAMELDSITAIEPKGQQIIKPFYREMIK